jgi:hypothetical protein
MRDLHNFFRVDFEGDSKFSRNVGKLYLFDKVSYLEDFINEQVYRLPWKTSRL